MDYRDALTYMNGRLRLGVKLGNDRFHALLERLGSPHESLRVVHVAGTKGKGSTTAMAANILHHAGHKTGQYLSPYVYDVRERIQIDGVPIPEADFARWVTTIRPHVEALEATDFGPTTEFELKTAVGLCFFAEQAVDYAVVEVGLGGRLDATNVFPRPLVTVITNIGYDHTELLGDTLTLIAGEKAGIIKPGVPCVTGVPLGGEADLVISRICRERDAPLTHVATGAENAFFADPDGSLTLRTPRRVLTDIRLGLHGAFQHANAAAALAALDAAPADALPPIPDAAVRRGLQAAYVPGRLELIAHRPTVLVDAAHNALAAAALADALRDEFGADNRRLLLVVGLKRTHDPESFLEPLAPLRPSVTIATQPSFQPRPATDVADAARRWDMGRIETIPSGVPDAVRHALFLARPDDILCVTGSFYTVGDLPPALWKTLLEERTPAPC